MKTSIPLLPILILATSTLADDRGPAAKSSPNQMPKSELRAPADADGRNHTPRPGALRMGNQTLVIPGEFRTLDGTGNNAANPEWGSTEEPFLRLTTPAYRFGHTLLSPQLLRLDASGREIEAGHLPLAQAFFNVAAITDQGGIDPILRGLAAQPAQELDNRLVDGVRNFLFGAPGSGGFDLASLNIQRGRDHGFAGYNSVRRELGLRAARQFSDITPDRDLQGRLASVYGSVEQIDLWVGLLAELPFQDALLGETAVTILRDQFTRLRDGDRFWYQIHLGREMASLIDRQTLARIIRRNTGIGNELQENVFMTPRPPVPQAPKGRPASNRAAKTARGRR